MKRRHEKPIPRTNPSGRKVWVARYTDRHGKRRSAGTFELKGPCRSSSPRADCCAQHAIDAAYDRDSAAPRRRDTVGGYFATWTQRHPRAERTNRTNEHRISRVLDVVLEGRPFRDWPLAEVRQRHAYDLVDVMLRQQGRAAAGAVAVLRAYSAMFKDAMRDELCEFNPFRDVGVRPNDPRVTKGPQRIRVRSWEDMHGFARAAARVRTGKTESAPLDLWRPVYAEAMIRVLSDCGLRLGELLALERRDLYGGACRREECEAKVPHLHIERTTWEGYTLQGTKTDHGKADAGRVVPVPDALWELLRALPARIDTAMLFPASRGGRWRARNFYRDVWDPTRKATGLDTRPHEFRHSWISLLTAAGIDPADLAGMAGHTVETMTSVYRHGLGRSYDSARQAVGA